MFAALQFQQDAGSIVYVAIDDRLDTFYQAKLERMSGDQCTVAYTEVCFLVARLKPKQPACLRLS